MKKQTERKGVDEKHVQSALEKVEVLKIQRGDLFKALFNLIVEVRQGTRHFKIYRQFKMYNDPSLNPMIYKAGESK